MLPVPQKLTFVETFEMTAQDLSNQLVKKLQEQKSLRSLGLSTLGIKVTYVAFHCLGKEPPKKKC